MDKQTQSTRRPLVTRLVWILDPASRSAASVNRGQQAQHDGERQGAEGSFPICVSARICLGCGDGHDGWTIYAGSLSPAVARGGGGHLYGHDLRSESDRVSRRVPMRQTWGKCPWWLWMGARLGGGWALQFSVWLNSTVAARSPPPTLGIFWFEAPCVGAALIYESAPAP